MLQELYRFSLFGRSIPIYGYGLMMVVGFLAGAYLTKWLARRVGLDGEAFINAALIGLVAGVVGARLSHVLENLGDFTRSDRTLGENLLAMVNVSSGGLTYYGGFLLAFPILVLYGIYKKVPIRVGMDIVAIGLMVGLAFGRIGCFLNGCCYGAECSLPWKVSFPYHSYVYAGQVEKGEIQPPPEVVQRDADGRPILVRDPASGQLRPVLKLPADVPRSVAKAQWSRPVHPAQLYSAFTAFLLAALLFAYFTIGYGGVTDAAKSLAGAGRGNAGGLLGGFAPGRVFAAMLMLEGLTRYLLELLRVEPPVWRTWSLGMLQGVAMVGMGVVMWWGFGRMRGAGRAEREG